LAAYTIAAIWEVSNETIVLMGEVHHGTTFQETLNKVLAYSSALLLVLSGVRGLALAQDSLPPEASAKVENRLVYLNESDPYYPHRTFPKLTTPQWIGEEGVEAAIVLSIDDMRGHEKWEAYLRPILERLKKIDGRAPVSIMACTVDPNHPHLQKWLKEGLSIEVHTVDHPCPLLKDNDFAKAKSTYDRCVDLMNLIPNNRPVAFRMPGCDSLNTPSPRFYAEIFNKKTPGGNFLTIDTSVFNLTTSADPDLPRELVVDADGKDKIRKYVPFPSFVNTIENYPYPYVIGGLCWEFPCGMPSDWQGHNPQKSGNPIMVADIKAMIDAVVIKQGVFSFVFHPYNWILPEEVVDIINYVVAKHGKKVKFLTFREAQERLDKNLLNGHSLRRADGSDSGVRLLDVDNDGNMDVVIWDVDGVTAKVWEPWVHEWSAARAASTDPGSARFAVLQKSGEATVIFSDRGYHFKDGGWRFDPKLARTPYPAAFFRDLGGDGKCEAICPKGFETTVCQWTNEGWKELPISLPLSGPTLRSGAVRFVDLDGDGLEDVVYSDDHGWGVWKLKGLQEGFVALSSGGRNDPGALPMIVRNGTNNGAWFHSKHLWVQNEDTAKMKDLVDRRSFEELLQKK
jgi:hypothetical protein